MDVQSIWETLPEGVRVLLGWIAGLGIILFVVMICYEVMYSRAEVRRYRELRERDRVESARRAEGARLKQRVLKGRY